MAAATEGILISRFALAILVVVLPLSLRGQTDTLAETQAIRELLSRQQAFWNDHRVDSFMVGYWPHDSLVFVGSAGLTLGYAAVLENYRQNYSRPEQMGTLDFVLHRIALTSPASAYVIGKWRIRREAGSSPSQGHFLLVLQKREGTWVIVADHSS